MKRKSTMRQKLQAIFLTILLVFGVSVVTLPNTGCTPSQTAIAADGNAVATALLSIAALEQPTNPALAANLTTAATALKQATANWVTGNPTADINSAAAAVEAVLAVIPTTAAYAPLVAIAVAALDVIIANTHPTPAAFKLGAIQNPYQSPQYKAHVSRSLLHPTLEGAFKHAWNSKAMSLGYRAAVLP